MKQQTEYVKRGRDSPVSTVIRLLAWRLGFDFRQRLGILLRVQTVSVAPPPSFLNKWDAFPGGKVARSVKLIPHIRLLTRLIMRGAIPALPHTSWHCA